MIRIHYPRWNTIQQALRARGAVHVRRGFEIAATPTMLRECEKRNFRLQIDRKHYTRKLGSWKATFGWTQSDIYSNKRKDSKPAGSPKYVASLKALSQLFHQLSSHRKQRTLEGDEQPQGLRPRSWSSLEDAPHN